MAPSKSKKEQKVRLSFTNWITGGSLISVPKSAEDGRRRAMKVTVTQLTDSINEAISENDKDDSQTDGHGTQDQSTQLERQKQEVDSATNAAATPGNPWTEEQDSQLREMKKANKSWKEITAALGASKKVVVTRHNELKRMENQAAEVNQANLNATGEGDNAGDGGFSDMAGLFDDAVGVGDTLTPQQEIGSTEGGSKQKDRQKSKAKSPSRQPQGDQRSEECDCPDCIQEEQVRRVQQITNNSRVGSTNPESSGSGGSREQSMHKSLQPDNIWTEEDCRIMEELEKRHRENKWLEIQAGFFNWTGRMVVAEIIEKKFKRDGFI